ncbi:hypothetical protein LO771_15215 [Streptacidiphilus sp. ASG 303]|uniref:hypothetical protein n=1 Tax=Streptacidiphilus sp. ASG 303 TaxID=2896847 RepID=UPI001E420BE8|nr:hypothetical protein [Streptacidiphilus sp. ASG 303]MCD0483709.1 hypothetical protein [Streptacidiphilus sp. ASG 303]
MSAYSDGGILAGEAVDAAAPVLTGGRARAAAPLGGAGAFGAGRPAAPSGRGPSGRGPSGRGPGVPVGARTGRGGPDRDRSRTPAAGPAAAGVPGRLLRPAAP